MDYSRLAILIGVFTFLGTILFLFKTNKKSLKGEVVISGKSEEFLTDSTLGKLVLIVSGEYFAILMVSMFKGGNIQEHLKNHRTIRKLQVNVEGVTYSCGVPASVYDKYKVGDKVEHVDMQSYRVAPNEWQVTGVW